MRDRRGGAPAFPQRKAPVGARPEDQRARGHARHAGGRQGPGGGRAGSIGGIGAGLRTDRRRRAAHDRNGEDRQVAERPRHPRLVDRQRRAGRTVGARRPVRRPPSPPGHRTAPRQCQVVGGQVPGDAAQRLQRRARARHAELSRRQHGPLGRALDPAAELAADRRRRTRRRRPARDPRGARRGRSVRCVPVELRQPARCAFQGAALDADRRTGSQTDRR